VQDGPEHLAIELGDRADLEGEGATKCPASPAGNGVRATSFAVFSSRATWASSPAFAAASMIGPTSFQ